MDDSKSLDLAAIFGHRITPEVRTLAAERILAGRPLTELARQTIKLVLEVASFEVLSQTEAAIVRGISEPTLRSWLRDSSRHPHRPILANDSLAYDSH